MRCDENVFAGELFLLKISSVDCKLGVAASLAVLARCCATLRTSPRPSLGRMIEINTLPIVEDEGFKEPIQASDS